MKRRFKARGSLDRGNTWKQARSTGWPITDINAKDDEHYGYVIAVDIGDTMVDVKIPERMLKLILKDVTKKKLFDDNGGQEDD
jgi:hypothetical protein